MDGNLLHMARCGYEIAGGVLLLQKNPAAARKDGVDRSTVLW